MKKYRKTRNTKEESFYNLITAYNENVYYKIWYKMKKAKAKKETKENLLIPVVNNPPDYAAANTNQTEKTTPIQSQTTNVLQPKPNNSPG